MPTQRPRHTVTETEEVQQALAPLREQGITVSFTALVIRGAQATLEDAHAGEDDDARRRALRERFLARTRSGAGIDIDAALTVREHGWIRE